MTLLAHLQDAYGIEVARLEALDRDVSRVRRSDGPDWVARVLPISRALAEGDVEILRSLADYPAERVAGPVTEFDGRSVVVTEWIEPVLPRRAAIVRAGGLRKLGSLLGALHTRPVPERPGGAWHHLAHGSVAEELRAIRQPETLVDGLPEALIHPDFVMRNVVASRDGMVLVDWTGAGRGPRAFSLAFTLWSVGFGGDLARVDRLAAGYRRHITLEPEELEALPALIRVRPEVFTIWRGGNADLDRIGEIADAIAARFIAGA